MAENPNNRAREVMLGYALLLCSLRYIYRMVKGRHSVHKKGAKEKAKENNLEEGMANLVLAHVAERDAAVPFSCPCSLSLSFFLVFLSFSPPSNVSRRSPRVLSPTVLMSSPCFPDESPSPMFVVRRPRDLFLLVFFLLRSFSRYLSLPAPSVDDDDCCAVYSHRYRRTWSRLFTCSWDPSDIPVLSREQLAATTFLLRTHIHDAVT